MKHFIALVSALVLTACGGGGGGSAPETPKAQVQPFTCVTQTQATAGKYRAAVFDTRRDEPSYTATGDQTTSFAATKLMIDRARCAGFDTIIFDVNVPMDIATGMLVLETSTENHRLPKDFWQYVSYTKSLGLKVAVRPIPVDYRDDETIQLDDHVPVVEFFATLKSFLVALAKQSDTNGVDIFFVGSYQSGLDSNVYEIPWTDIVDSVRGVYHGKITYVTCDVCVNIVWDKVDFVSVGIGSSVTNILNVYQRYQKPIFVDGAAFDSITSDPYASGTWRTVLTNQTFSTPPNYTLQHQKIDDFFRLVNNDFAGKIFGFSIQAYMPWLQDKWIQDPQNSLDRTFKLFDTLSYSMYNNIEAQSVIQSYLSKPWN